MRQNYFYMWGDNRGIEDGPVHHSTILINIHLKEPDLYNIYMTLAYKMSFKLT